MRVLLVGLVLLLIRTVSGGCNQTLVPDDVSVLLAAKDVLGDSEEMLTDWNQRNSSEACCWTGVTCLLINSVQRVFVLNLTSVGFNGSLPAAMGNLTALTVLDFSSNSLSGEVPSSWSGIASLLSLSLSGNKLSGSLDFLQNMTNLQSAILGNNSFEGRLDELPFKNLTSLRYLDLSGNLFTGTFPLWLTYLRSLVGVFLGNNPNLSPSPLPQNKYFYWTALFDIRFDSMNLVGPIPPDLAKPSLLRLDLSNNSLNGTLPIEFEKFGYINLKYTSYYPDISVLLGSNQLSGDLSAIPLMPFVETLNLSSNNFYGSFPKDKNWTILKTLDLSKNNVTMDISSLDQMPSLTNLVLRATFFEDRVLPDVSNWSILETIDLSENNLEGTISSGFYINAKTVRDFILDGNSFTGTVPADFFAQSQLRELKLRGNRLTGLPESLNDLVLTQHLQVLDLGNNFLDSFPSSFKSFTRLRELYLDHNNLSGPVPDFIGSASFLQTLDLSNNRFFSSEIPQSFAEDGFEFDDLLEIFKSKSFLALLQMNLSNCGLSGEISTKIGSLSRLSALDLSYNKLIGNIPDLSRTNLTSLDLSDNKLEGSVPDFIGYLPLKKLNLRNNNFSGYLPESIFNSSFSVYLRNCDSYQPGNEGLLVNCTNGIIQNDPWPPHVDSPSSSGLKQYQIIIIIVGGILLISIGMFFAYLLYRSRQKKNSSFLTMKIQEHFVKSIPIKAIREATENFSDRNVLGGGSFGIVYRGRMKNGETWAVKRTKSISVQSLEVFQKEVDTISRMNHKNLVKLFGFCDEDNEQILVYEYVPNGTLRAALQLEKVGSIEQALTFEERLEIALGAAAGLRYLHTQAKPTIIHRDVKSENILLDAKLQAKVCDFGLLKGNDDEGILALRTRVAGTHGYMDPEYYSTYKVTSKSDVYSFGVVLLELITGKGAVILDTDAVETDDEDASNLTSLASWALERLRSSLGLLAIVDPNLDSNFPLEAMEAMASIAATCLQKVSKYRPDMADVESQLRCLQLKLGKIEETSVSVMGEQKEISSEEMKYPSFKASSTSADSSLFRSIQEGSVLLAR